MDVVDRGEGPALLLIHGFPLDRRIWEHATDRLPASKVRVVAPDLPGFGGSGSDPLPKDLEGYARALLGLMDSLGVPRFAAAGHSMGGYVLFALHRLAPERLSAAALVSSRSNADSDEARKAREDTAARALREGASFLAETMPGRTAAPDAHPALLARVRDIMSGATGPGVAAASRAMAARPDATPQLSRFSFPALVVAGRLDRIVPAAESEAMARGIPGARLVWAERSGHLPMMEEPQVVTGALAALLGRA